MAEDNGEEVSALKGMTKIFPRDRSQWLHRDEDTAYVHFLRGEPPGFPRFSRRCDLYAFWGGTVSYLMLQYAHWTGCDPIYVIGMDMSYDVPDGAGKRITSEQADVNHFHPDYFGPGRRYHDPEVDRMIRCLERAGKEIVHDGSRIYNAGLGGRLEVYPRVDFQGVFRNEDNDAGLSRTR
ncbi:MAG: hypothetical protein ACLFVU_04980 [Phycisphaerae bacterium]